MFLWCKAISIHALREEGDPGGDHRDGHPNQFLSTPSARRATWPTSFQPPTTPISIHALREEGDSACRHTGSLRTYFYPRPPRGGRLPSDRLQTWENTISIHALREEGDGQSAGVALAVKISIHALREEGDHKTPELTIQGIIFLSTPSARRATS